MVVLMSTDVRPDLHRSCPTYTEMPRAIKHCATLGRHSVSEAMTRHALDDGDEWTFPVVHVGPVNLDNNTLLNEERGDVTAPASRSVPGLQPNQVLTSPLTPEEVSPAFRSKAFSMTHFVCLSTHQSYLFEPLGAIKVEIEHRFIYKKDA